MTAFEAVDERNFETQVLTPDRVYAHVIEEGGFMYPSEGSWAYIGQSGNVMYGFREDGKIVDVGSMTVAHIGKTHPTLAERIADSSMDMMHQVGDEKIKLRTFVEQQEILKAISNIALNGAEVVG